MTRIRTLLSFLLTGVVLLCGMGAASAQLVSVSPQTLSFVYQIGGPNPPAQNLFLSNIQPTQFSVSISGAPWLAVSPSTGVTPSTLVASVTGPSGATPGTLTGTIIISPVASTDATATVVAVSLQVLAPSQGTLQVYPNTIALDYSLGGPPPTPSGFSVTSTGAAAAFSLSTSTPWLAVSANSYVTPATAYVTIVLSAITSPGVYYGFVTVSPSYAGGSPQQVSVTLRVSSQGALIASPNSLSFNYQQGGYLPQPQVVNIVNSSGGAATYSVTTVTTSGGGWLGSNVSSGTTPSAIVVSATPGALAPGTYSGIISLNSNTAGVSATQIPVSLTVSSSSQLLVDPESLFFNYQAGGAAPAAQYISVQSTGSPVGFGVGVLGPAWITASPGFATTPAGIMVSAKPPSTTVPGLYTASVTITPTTGGGRSVTVPVSVNVTSPNYLTLGRNSVAIDYQAGGTNPAPEFISVSSSGGALEFEAAAATAGFGPWLSVSQSSTYTPAVLTIGVNPTGLAVGTYSGTVVVNSDGGSNPPQSIAVTLTVKNSATFTASPFALVFSYQINSVPPAAQVLVVSSGSTTTSFTANPVTTSGGNWLLVAGSGTTPGPVAVAVSGGSLGVGTYNARILIASADGSIPTLEVPVILNVSAVPVFLPSANEVSFQYETSGAAPPPQKVTVQSNNGVGTVFYSGLVTADGGTWLSVTPNVAATPSDLTISVDPTGLAPGLYYGLIGVYNPGNDTPASFIPVSLQVSSGPILGVAAQSIWLTAIAGIGGVVTQTINVGSVGPPAQFSVVTSGGAWLNATPSSGLSGSSITVLASANNLNPGFYLGLVTIQIPGVPNSQQMVPVVFSVTQF